MNLRPAPTIMASFSRPRFSTVLLIVLSFIALTGFGCRARNPDANLGDDIKIVVWGLWQDSNTMEPAIGSFKEGTGVSIEYKKIASVSEYERELLEALAEGRGPDIFVIHHTWVDAKRGLMTPAPDSVIDERALREEFVDVVAADVIRSGQVYALPTSVDTMALYYNKDILSAAGIARPPRTWEEFQTVIERITQVTRLGSIVQSGAALGTAANVNRAADILQLLFLQSGSTISGEGGSGINNDTGSRSLTFYTDFANKSKKVYTWDLQQDYSLDAFAEEEAAMMLNYSYHLPTIQAKNPRLRFAISPMPQISDSKVINFAAYWPYSVSNQSSNPDTAWRFIRHLTSQSVASGINQAQGVPPARRDSVDDVVRDPTLGVFAEQTLTAVSWPRSDIVAIDAIFNTMVDNVVTGAATPAESLNRAAGQLGRIQVKPTFEESSGGGEPLGPSDIGLF